MNIVLNKVSLHDKQNKSLFRID